MVIRAFPSVDQADESGLLAIGGDLEVASLVLAYRSGIFPWPFDEAHLTWFSPPKRAILCFDELHISRSLHKFRRTTSWKVLFDVDFHAVILRCAELKNRGRQGGTWITPDIVSAYCDMHAAGYAHSVECYDGSKLIGGLYGVCIGSMFAAESSFYRESNASKLALCELVLYLKQHGFTWLDCQQLTPFSKGFGAKEISRKQFIDLLNKATSKPSSAFENSKST
ncbi:MAG: leucyl/phenylalanyl-tRNA--protein transferase [Oligoflexia bacterium]|nr:leucyl/phenylalanyl-tRNA--protein transferase [Oligoflexia bacterium]